MKKIKLIIAAVAMLSLVFQALQSMQTASRRVKVFTLVPFWCTELGLFSLR